MSRLKPAAAALHAPHPEALSAAALVAAARVARAMLNSAARMLFYVGNAAMGARSQAEKDPAVCVVMMRKLRGRTLVVYARQYVDNMLRTMLTFSYAQGRQGGT
jgi:hypothetical protein